MSDAGMCSCQNGHTFCEDHELSGNDKELSIEEKRQVLISRWENDESSWNTDEDRQEYIKEIKDYSEDAVEDEYDDFVSDEGISPDRCPVCQFQKVNVGEMYQYAIRLLDMTNNDILAKAKGEFKSYVEFKEFIKPAKE